MFYKVITGDETWCFQYDPETKRQSMQLKTDSRQPKRALMSRSQFKIILVCFFHHKGTVHYEFIAQGQAVNQQCYLEVLTKLRESVRRKRPELWHEKWILHHDSAPGLGALESSSSWLTNSLQKWAIHSIHLT
jgi:hypothetical protein